MLTHTLHTHTHTGTEWASATNVFGSEHDPVKSRQEIHFPGLFSSINPETELETSEVGKKSTNYIYFKGIKLIGIFSISFISTLFQAKIIVREIAKMYEVPIRIPCRCKMKPETPAMVIRKKKARRCNLSSKVISVFMGFTFKMKCGMQVGKYIGNENEKKKKKGGRQS